MLGHQKLAHITKFRGKVGLVIERKSKKESDFIQIVCNSIADKGVKNALDTAKIIYAWESPKRIASFRVCSNVSLAKGAKYSLHPIEKLEDDKDVQQVHSNGEFSNA